MIGVMAIWISTISMIATYGSHLAGFSVAATVTMICIPAIIGGTIPTIRIGTGTTHTTATHITGIHIDTDTGITFLINQMI